MELIRINDEVYYSNSQIAVIESSLIGWLKEKAMANPRKRARICCHKDPGDALHEMVIALANGIYIKPHQHLNKTESFHIIEGRSDVALFDNRGAVREIIPMGDYASGRVFYFRIPDRVYHSVIVGSDFLVFQETTSGPFDPSDTATAAWAPDETDACAGIEYLRKCIERRTV